MEDSTLPLDTDRPGDSDFWINDSKFRPLRANVDLVLRDRLIDIITPVLERKLAMVIAPAGFGKSTLLTQWRDVVRTRGVICAWLALDGNDSDPNQFMASLAIALSYAGADIGELEIGARNGFSDSPMRLVLSNIFKLLHGINTKCVIVLDDYHILECKAIDDLVKQLLREAPKTLSIVINSRKRPDIDVPVLIASGYAFEIGADQLRLTEGETIDALGETISKDDAQDIYTNTEGWPVAVQLARVQKKARPSSPLKMPAQSWLIASYLTDQVLTTLTEKSRQFLLTVSVLEQFNPSLADMVGQWNNSRKMLQLLEPLYALLIPLDVDFEWYRLHPLVAEHLREVLQKEDPERYELIVKRASAWHADQGEIAEAVKYAAKIGAFDDCEKLILDAGGWKIILTAGIGVLRNSLRCLPNSFISTRPRLLIAKAYLQCKKGDQLGGRILFDVAEGAQVKGTDPEFDKDHLICGAIFRSYEDDEEWAYSFRSGGRRDSVFDDLEPLEVGSLKTEEVMANFALGDFSQASEALQSAIHHIRHGGSIVGLNYCYLHGAISAIHLAEFDVAHVNISRAIELCEENFGGESGLKHLALVLEFALRIWAGEGKSNEVNSFLQTLSQVEELDGWADIYLIGLDVAQFYGSQTGNHDFLRDVIARYSKIAQQKNLDRLDTVARNCKLMTKQPPADQYEMLALFEEVRSWVRQNSPCERPRSWFGYFSGVTALAEKSEEFDSEIEEFLVTATAHADSIGATLHSVRLRIVEATYYEKWKSSEQSKAMLLQAIKAAQPSRMFGPFMQPDILRKLLEDLRSDLHVNDGEKLAYGFITEALRRLEILRPNKPNTHLSPRELDVIEQLNLGLSNKVIARQLELTDNTVKFHIRNIFAKLDVNRRAQAILKARELGLVD